MLAVETLETRELVHEIATLKIAAAMTPELLPVLAARLVALLAECKRRRVAMQRPASPYALSPRRV